MSFNTFNDELKDLDDLDFDAEDGDSDEDNDDELEYKNNDSLMPKKQLKKDYLKDIDDLSGDEEDDNHSDMNDDEGDDDNSIQDQMLLDSKDIVKLVKAKLSSSVGLFRKSIKYQSQFSIIKNKVQQQNDEFNSDYADSTRPTSSVQLSSGMGMINIGNLDTDREYQLILDCNKLIHDIDDEIAETHRFLVEVYAKKFPELEQFIPNKLDYVRTVQRIGNEMDMTAIELGDILPSSAVMIVSVTGSTTQGQALKESELKQCMDACDEVLALTDDKALILRYVESRMSHLAPNLTTCIGSRVAAQLVGLAGGITALSKIPSCNVAVMGQEKRNLAGFSNVSSLPHTGVLYQCDLVQKCPHSVRRKLLKIIANKVVLLARIDSYATMSTDAHESVSSSGNMSVDINNSSSRKLQNHQGERFREEIEEKIEKLLEPPKARTKKALPIPEEKKRSKRGGKRVRKFKERYAMTEMRAQHNKMGFGPSSGGEYGDSAMGLDAGMIGAKDSGKLRSTLKKEVSLMSKKQKIKGGGSGRTGYAGGGHNASSASVIRSSGVGGSVSSLAFTPVQGIELVNPKAAADRVKEANTKWFNQASGFMSAAPGAR